MVGRMEIVFYFQVGRFGIDVKFATHHLNPNTVFVLHISCILDANERGKVPLATAKKVSPTMKLQLVLTGLLFMQVRGKLVSND